MEFARFKPAKQSSSGLQECSFFRQTITGDEGGLKTDVSDQSGERIIGVEALSGLGISIDPARALTDVGMDSPESGGLSLI